MQVQQNIEPELRGRNATVKTVERVAVPVIGPDGRPSRLMAK